MDTEYLDRLAHQLRIGRTAACRRAINRILEEMKKRCENGEYRDPTEAESAFRKFVEDEGSCQKAEAVWPGSGGLKQTPNAFNQLPPAVRLIKHRVNAAR